MSKKSIDVLGRALESLADSWGASAEMTADALRKFSEIATPSVHHLFEVGDYVQADKRASPGVVLQVIAGDKCGIVVASAVKPLKKYIPFEDACLFIITSEKAFVATERFFESLKGD